MAAGEAAKRVHIVVEHHLERAIERWGRRTCGQGQQPKGKHCVKLATDYSDNDHSNSNNNGGRATEANCGLGCETVVAGEAAPIEQ